MGGRPIVTGLLALGVLALMGLAVSAVVSSTDASTWLIDNNDALASLSSLASTAGLLLTGIGVVFAGYQLRRQRDTLQAKAMYELMKDARTEASLTMEASLRAGASAATDAEQRSFQFQAGRLLNLYAAAYQLRKGAVLGEPQWRLILDDLVSTLENDEMIEERWEAVKSHYDEDFVAAVEVARSERGE